MSFQIERELPDTLAQRHNDILGESSIRQQVYRFAVAKGVPIASEDVRQISAIDSRCPTVVIRPVVMSDICRTERKLCPRRSRTYNIYFAVALHIFLQESIRIIH